MSKEILAVADAIAAEVVRATMKHGPMKSAHEGYAIMLEEIDELWDEVKKRHPDAALMRNEAIQIGAMAARFVLDITPLPQAEPKPGHVSITPRDINPLPRKDETQGNGWPVD